MLTLLTLQWSGEPIGRKKVSDIWFRALQAEVTAMPGSNSGEISFRNLFLILTTKMVGADALCETVDGSVKTSTQKVLSLCSATCAALPVQLLAELKCGIRHPSTTMLYCLRCLHCSTITLLYLRCFYTAASTVPLVEI